MNTELKKEDVAWIAGMEKHTAKSIRDHWRGKIGFDDPIAIAQTHMRWSARGQTISEGSNGALVRFYDWVKLLERILLLTPEQVMKLEMIDLKVHAQRHLICLAEREELNRWRSSQKIFGITPLDLKKSTEALERDVAYLYSADVAVKNADVYRNQVDKDALFGKKKSRK